MVAVTLAGCSSTRIEGALGLPGAETPVRVTDVVGRGDYLEATLLGTGAEHLGGRVMRPGLALRFFFPWEPTCRGVLVPEAEVAYVEGGRLGRVRSAKGECDPVGIGSLRAWRDRRPRRREDRLGIPRSQAVFEVIYRDEEVALVRGRFPLANRFDWVGGNDTIAAIPRTPECERVLERGVAALEFRVRGDDPLRLIEDRGYCPVIGLIHPGSRP